MNKREKNLHSKVLDLLIDTICVVDNIGRYIYVNAACEKLLGYSKEELIGKNMIDYVFPDDREKTLKAAEDIMRGNAKTSFDNRYVRKDGSVVHIMWSASWSELDGVRVAIARDITELKNNILIHNALYQISEAVYLTDGLPSLCQHIKNVIDNLLPIDDLIVALLDNTTNKITFVHLNEQQSSELEAIITVAIQTGKAILQSGPNTDRLIVPLVIEQSKLGALITQVYSENGRYTKDHKDLLEYVAGQIASAVKRKQTEANLRHIASHDVLTSIPNRMLFEDRFDMALKTSSRRNERLALLYLDLNGFKVINDKYGHEAGDLLLREVAGRIGKCMRDTDIIGRRGGDEFTVVVTDIKGQESVDIVINKLTTAIKEPYQYRDEHLVVSVSIGTAIYPEHGEKMEQLINHADADMYACKQRKTGLI